MEYLRTLGLTKYEASLYLALLRSGRSNARAIAGRAEVPITAAYPALRSLVRRGLIQEIEGEVALFEALDPAVGLQSLTERMKQQIDDTALALAPVLESVQRERPGPPVDVVSLSIGIEASHAITLQFLANARKSVFIMGWTFHTARRSKLLLRTLGDLAQRGIDVRLLLTSTRSPLRDFLDEASRRGVKIRYTAMQNFSLVLCDGTMCKITLKSPELPDRFNIRVNDLSLSSALAEYFSTAWKRAVRRTADARTVP